MPAFFRTPVLLGAVFSLLTLPLAGAMANPAIQTAPTSDLPTVETIPMAAPPPDEAPVIIQGTPPSDTAAPALAPATRKKSSHKKAKSSHHTSHHTAKKSKSSRTSKKTGGDAHLRDAQTHLANLNYYKDVPDGRNGPKTKAAIKAFQRDHKLAASGKLTAQTYAAIIASDKQNAMSSPPPPVADLRPMPQTIGAAPLPPEAAPVHGPDFYATHPDFYGHYNQSYENPVLLGPTQTLYSRFAKVELTEDPSSSAVKKYNISLNGLPLVMVDNQPAVIGVSRTFQVGDEDIMIFTSFKDNNPTCAYDYNLLILGADGTKSRQITSCGRGYQAKVSNGQLFITFPESDMPGNLGSTWKYDHGDLQRL